MSLVAHINYIVNLWGCGYHPALQETAIDNAKAAALKMEEENVRLKRRVSELERELKDERVSSAIEERWKCRQGEEHGSY